MKGNKPKNENPKRMQEKQKNAFACFFGIFFLMGGGKGSSKGAKITGQTTVGIFLPKTIGGEWGTRG